MVRSRSIRQGGLLLAVALFAAPAVAAPPVFSRLFTQKVPADPEAEYEIEEPHGPWLILAASFGGETGRQQARQLILELRRDFNLPAYLYVEHFDYSQPVAGASSRTRRMRAANPARYDACAVLVGDFDSVDSPAIKETLERIKYARPASLDHSDDGTTSQRFAVFRNFARSLTEKEAERKRGPMGSAFVTRNPLLPDEFFAAPEVDSFVRKLNAEVEHSLLDCPGKYTVVVRTFEGASAVDFGNGHGVSELVPNADRLDQAAESAHRMVRALRKKGVEAYEFHDRYRSLVTVGSFDSLGQPQRGDGFAYEPAIQRVMNEYRGTTGEVVQTSTGPQMKANTIKGIPFDLQPRPLAVPQASKRSFYAGGWLNGK